MPHFFLNQILNLHPRNTDLASSFFFFFLTWQGAYLDPLAPLGSPFICLNAVHLRKGLQTHRVRVGHAYCRSHDTHERTRQEQVPQLQVLVFYVLRLLHVGLRV